MPTAFPEDDERLEAEPVLAVEDLTVRLSREKSTFVIASDLRFEIAPGETLALSGPSGAGKTATALALIGLRPGGDPAMVSGSIRLHGRELVGLEAKRWRAVRGAQIGLVPQDPGASLTPVHRVGKLLTEAVEAHSIGPATSRAIELLEEVGFGDPEAVAQRFPHELSGGMQQRVAIAAALAGAPDLLIADEPTSSLDVIASGEIMDLLGSIQRRRSMAMLLISHDTRLLDARADRVLELRDGRLGERRPRPAFDFRPVADDLAASPARPGDQPPLLELAELRMTFDGTRGSAPVTAVDRVSLEVRAGDALGLVGSTGSGKSTLAWCAVRLIEPTGGRVSLGGQDVTHLPQRRLGPARADLAMVFQNPASSLNPRRRIAATIEEPLRSRGMRGEDLRQKEVLAATRAARLDPALLDRLPSELSGGQQQRVAIARALVTHPRLLILDEPFTALDEEVEEDLSELLLKLRQERDLAILLITHDMRLVTRLTDRVAVMSEGRIVEQGETAVVTSQPSAPITKRLVAAAFATPVEVD